MDNHMYKNVNLVVETFDKKQQEIQSCLIFICNWGHVYKPNAQYIMKLCKI